jgi:hypothetical protein
VNLIERFEAYAADFERTFVDDDWRRLEPYFTEGAVYVTLGSRGQRAHGREAALETLRRAVSNFDRRCRSRVLQTTGGPAQVANEVSRQWACTFTCPGAPDLHICGSERAVYQDDRICLLEEKLTDESQQLFERWVREHAAKLAPNTAMETDAKRRRSSSPSREPSS